MVWREVRPLVAEANRLRFGIVGCGGVVSELHLPAWRALSARAELVACCDSSAQAMDRVSQEWPRARRFDSLDAFLTQAEGLDFAVLATPHNSHYAIASKLMAKGLHLLCEKPLTLGLGQARELVAIAESRHLVLTPIHNYRYYDNARQAMDKSTRARLGDIVSVSVRLHSGPLHKLSTPWRWNEREQRTLLFDWCYHLADLVLLFVGSVAELRFVDAESDRTGLQQVAFGTLHQNGARGLFDLMVDSSCDSSEIRVLGEKGALSLEFAPIGFRMLPSQDNPVFRGLADLKRAIGYFRALAREKCGARLNRNGAGHLRLFAQFLDAVNGAGPNPVPTPQVLELIGLLEAVATRAYGEDLPWAAGKPAADAETQAAPARFSSAS